MKAILRNISIGAVCAAAFAFPVSAGPIKFEAGTTMVIDSSWKAWKKSRNKRTDTYVYQGFKKGTHIFKGKSTDGNALVLEFNANGDLKRFKRGNKKASVYPTPGILEILPGQTGSWGKWKKCVSSKPKREKFKTKCSGRKIKGNNASETWHRDVKTGFWSEFAGQHRGPSTNTLMLEYGWKVIKAPAMSGTVSGF